MNRDAQYIIDSLTAIQNTEKARWLENYVKHDIKSLGVGIPKIREIVQSLEKTNQISKQQVEEQILFLDDLMQQAFTEPKLAAILFIQLYWKTNRPGKTLEITSKWLDRGWITDWNVCDWLCVRLLSPILDKEPALAISEFTLWNGNPNLWKSRASLVPFAQAKTIGKHAETIWSFSTALIRREERFCKTAVGWVLREYSKIDDKFVRDFLEQHKGWTSKEVIKNATKYL